MCPEQMSRVHENIDEGDGGNDQQDTGSHSDNEAAKKCGYKTLERASPELQNDREVVLAAAMSYGPALEYASEQLRNDKEVVLAALRSYGRR